MIITRGKYLRKGTFVAHAWRQFIRVGTHTLMTYGTLAPSHSSFSLSITLEVIVVFRHPLVLHSHVADVGTSLIAK